jgi:hypothetical protein
MARVLGNPMGELRGKLAGSVYSRNRAGQFVRGYVHPAQANSQAQLDARASFGAASQTWKTQSYLPMNTTTKSRHRCDPFAKKTT